MKNKVKHVFENRNYFTNQNYFNSSQNENGQNMNEVDNVHKSRKQRSSLRKAKNQFLKSLHK